MTVIEIAKKAGVSIATVDRVLHKRGRVSEATRKAIQDIVDSEGYQANPLARHLKLNKEHKVGLLIPKLEDESRYWTLIDRGMRDAAAELSAFSFRMEAFTFNRPDRASLMAAFDRMAAADCCAWVISPVMQEETLVLLMGTERKVPYLFIDSPLPGAEPISTVAQDPFRGGFLAGRLMDLLERSPGTYATIKPFTEAFNLNERARGFGAWFEGRADRKVVHAVCGDGPAEELGRTLDALVAGEMDLRGIFVVSSMGHRIADHLAERGLKDRIAVIGYDLVAENVESLKAGRLDCLISQRPQEQARQAMQQIYRSVVLGEEAAERLEMPFDIFFRENLG